MGDEAITEDKGRGVGAWACTFAVCGSDVIADGFTNVSIFVRDLYFASLHTKRTFRGNWHTLAAVVLRWFQFEALKQQIKTG